MEKYKPKYTDPDFFLKNFYNPNTFKMEEKECIRVIIDGEDYRICEDSSKNRACSEKLPCTYNDGIINSIEDQRKVERVGMLGETAVAKITNSYIDNVYRRGGDDYDFTSSFGTYDVKCSSAIGFKRSLIFRNYIGKEKIYDLKCDFYISAYVEYEDREKETATVILVGYVERSEVEKCEIKEGVGRKHLNYVIQYGITRSIREILNHGLSCRPD